MPETTYTYSKTTDFAAGVNVGLLHAAIEDEAGITVALDRIRAVSDEDAVSIVFADALSAGEKTTLDGLVAAHVGYPTMEFVASTKLFAGEQIIVSPTYAEVEGVVTNVGFFIPDLTKAIGRVTLLVKTVGAGAELKLVETEPDLSDPVDVSAAQVLPDTVGAWQMYQFNSNVPPRAGDKFFALHAKLNGAVSLTLKAASLVLLRVL